ncbi:glycosyltransferase family 2 protein, partial [Streptomyces ardesiacus]|uniref:glycosyltransferase family 2 protein n=1 Tax=Streptomyces ardesiacus TaxID=285564 RepID=UPI0036536CA4
MKHAAQHHGPATTRERSRPDPTRPAPVGIVIATRNRRASLAVTVRNLLALPERPEVLVVDNASTDGTRAMLARDVPHVRVLAPTRNHGALARNHGVRALDTPYV